SPTRSSTASSTCAATRTSRPGAVRGGERTAAPLRLLRGRRGRARRTLHRHVLAGGVRAAGPYHALRQAGRLDPDRVGAVEVLHRAYELRAPSRTERRGYGEGVPFLLRVRR